MNKKIIVFCLIPIFSAFSGCGRPVTKNVQINHSLLQQENRKQKEQALESELDYMKRLFRVGYPLLIAGTKFSEKKLGLSLGAVIINKHDIDEDFQDAASRLYNLGEELQILYVVPKSCSDVAGLQANDILVSINSLKIPRGKNANHKFHKLINKHLRNKEMASIEVIRNGSKHIFSVKPNKVCDNAILLKDSDEINAYTDGKSIIMTKGMLRFLNDDKELALVLGHELAHIIMGHVSAKKKNKMIGSAFGYAVDFATGVNLSRLFGNLSARIYTQSHELEADYIGLYIIANSGIEIDNAAKLWRKLGTEHPKSIKKSFMSTHPSSPERLIALENSIKEIQRKQSAKLALKPEYKN